jgi:pimeloyl-ACP methyl ester carboxylesterase
MRIIPLLLALASMLSVAPATRAAPAEYRPTPCTGDFAAVAQQISCGLLLVDETRGSGNGRRVSIPVAVVRALHPRAGSLPVVFLHGGPGDEVISGLPDLLRSERWKQFVAQDQDWIFLDQRGGGLSAPLLDCGSRLLLNDAGPLSPFAAGTLIACGARHVAAGVDLSAYNAIATAADLQDLLQLLHLRQVDLFGVSYGSRVAFTVMRLHPELVRAAVLDSVWPPEALWAEGGPKMIADAVHLLFGRCAADRACHAAFADPERDLRTLASRLLAGPLTTGGKTYTADDLGGFLMDTLYSAEGARALPRDVRAFARGDLRALDEMKETSDTYFELQHLTHLCKEEFPFERRDHVADGVEGDPIGLVSVQSFQRYFDVCASLPVGAPEPAEGQPVGSKVPTLFLSAELDPGCPPALARAAASRFENSQFVQFPNTTHGLSRVSACARGMIQAFLRDPSQPVDRSCVGGSREPFGFIVRARPRARN